MGNLPLDLSLRLQFEFFCPIISSFDQFLSSFLFFGFFFTLNFNKVYQLCEEKNINFLHKNRKNAKFGRILHYFDYILNFYRKCLAKFYTNFKLISRKNGKTEDKISFSPDKVYKNIIQACHQGHLIQFDPCSPIFNSLLLCL
jgi:hypothetical protein